MKTVPPLKNAILDWWRGYSEADVLSVVAKMQAETRPYAVVPITYREMKALRDPRTWYRTKNAAPQETDGTALTGGACAYPPSPAAAAPHGDNSVAQRNIHEPI